MTHVKKKNRKGRACIIGGSLLIAAALLLTVYNLLEQVRVAEITDSVLARIESASTQPETQAVEAAHAPQVPASAPASVAPPAAQEQVLDYVLNPEMEMPEKTVDGRQYIGVLSIPDLEREMPVASEWSYSTLRVAPCRYAGSVYTGDIVICAHNYDRHFGGLKKLRVGAQLSFTDMEGNEFLYRVVELETLQPTETEQMKNGNWDLTLFTCTVGGSTRVTVRCELIDPIG